MGEVLGGQCHGNRYMWETVDRKDSVLEGSAVWEVRGKW